MKLAALLAVALVACDPPPPAAAAPAAPAPVPKPVTRPGARAPILVLGMGEDPATTAQVEQVRVANHVAALAVAIVHGRIVTLAATGTLPGATAPLTTTDPLPLEGAMNLVTASIAGRLVDRGALTWEAIEPHGPPTTDAEGAIAADRLLKAVVRAGGKPWPDLVREEVFAPLGMSGCTVDLAALRCSISEWARFAAAQAGAFAGTWLTPISHDHVATWIHRGGATVLALVPQQPAGVAVVAIGQAPGTATAAQQIVDAQLARTH